MLPYATPPIAAQVDPYKDTERDTLRAQARRRLGAPAQAGARIALALCEVEAGMRSPLQLERLCHLTLWPKLAARLRRSGGPAVTARSWAGWSPRSTPRGWPRSRCSSTGVGGWCRWRVVADGALRAVLRPQVPLEGAEQRAGGGAAVHAAELAQ
jgi:hypothetical protein